MLCYLPLALVRFVYDQEKILAGGTIHWELIPWTELSVLLIVECLLMILLSGYTARLYRGTAAPVFDDWGALTLDGIRITIVNLLCFVPFTIISLVILVLLFPLVFSVGPDAIALWLVYMATALLIASVPLIFAFLYSTLGSVRYARTGQIREGIRFSAFTTTIRTIGWGTYLLTLFILAVLVLIFGIVQSVLGNIPFAGWLIRLALSPFIFVFTAHYISRIYDHGIPASPAPAGVSIQQEGTAP